MRILSKTKLLLHKILPKNIFNFVYRTWSLYAKRKNESTIAHLDKNFKEKQTITLHRGDISFPIVLDPKNGVPDSAVLRDHEYEPEISDVMRRFTKKGSDVIDVGANIGLHALYLSKLVGDEGHVIAFEPVTKFREQFEESIKIGKVENIKIYPYALGTSESTETIYVSKTNAGNTSFIKNDDPASKEVVEIKTLDSFNFSNISFMKIDVEGFEEGVLRGGLETIKKNKPSILFEFSPLYYRKKGENIRNILDLIVSLNYSLFDIEDNEKEIKDLDDFVSQFEPTLRGQTNLICKPNI